MCRSTVQGTKQLGSLHKNNQNANRGGTSGRIAIRKVHVAQEKEDKTLGSRGQSEGGEADER